LFWVTETDVGFPEIHKFIEDVRAHAGAKERFKIQQCAQRSTMLHRFPYAVLVLCFAALPVSAQDTPWKVGLAEVKITPEMPVVLAGYGGRTKPFEKVAADLYVKVMVLEDSAGHRGV